ncbi:hypothetical protein ACIQCX_18795 [Enterobacter cancerogenus]|uniref:hypothetical protein n=1 Tax=Enterobacter cancerogenus TaxID=69218 RepID=UPI003807E608
MHKLSGGALIKHEPYSTDELNELLGNIVTELLERNNSITINYLIEAIYQISQKSEDEKIIVRCNELLFKLNKLLH